VLAGEYCLQKLAVDFVSAEERHRKVLERQLECVEELQQRRDKALADLEDLVL